MKNLFLLLTFALICACNSNEVNNSKIVYQKVNVPCNEAWNNLVCYDTVFANGVTFKMTAHCQNKIDYIDSIENESGEILIRSWHNLELNISSNLFAKNLIITKENFKDSLAPDLFSNGFLVPPFRLIFDKKDSSIIFKSFIGRADSDVGDIYVMKINKDKSTQVIAVEDSEMED